MYYASRQICSCHWQYSCSSCSLAVSDGRNEPSFLLSSITAEITKLTLPPQEGHIRLESDTGLSKESSVTFKWSLSPSAENVDYRTDTFSSDKNVFITGGRGEEFPWIRAEDNARLVVLRVCWGKKKKEKRNHSATNCSVCCGSAAIMMQQGSTALRCLKKDAAGSHRNVTIWVSDAVCDSDLGFLSQCTRSSVNRPYWKRRWSHAMSFFFTHHVTRLGLSL